jgi:hypothetical protein
MKTIHLAGMTTAAGLAIACGNMPAEGSGWRVASADANAVLTVRTEGGPRHGATDEASGRSAAGETVHRVVRGEDGGVLFAYDLVMRRTEDRRRYVLQLLPSAGEAPTFSSRRDITAAVDEDLVRVELMEQPTTHEKIVDVYRLTRPAKHWSLMEAHNALFRWVHGL